MWEFCKESTPVARKEYRCDACGITGLSQQGRVDRLEPGNWPRCKTCRRIRKRWEPPA